MKKFKITNTYQLFWSHKKDRQEHNPHWPQIPDLPCKILIVGGSGSGNMNALLNLINHQKNDDTIDKIYLFARDAFGAKYQYFINKRDGVGSRQCNNQKTLIEYSSNMNDAYKDFE